MSTAHSSYRKDIDGLRAIAVASVLFYHLNISGFSGGYVGVDIFFVISGFLISGLIAAEYRTIGKFNYLNFYIRRARRILPALFVTIAATLLAAALLFPRSLVLRTGESALYSVISVSNFYFWQKTDYFDIEAISKPLLHTWSLGIEEQFYLIWPLLLVTLLRIGRFARMSALVALGLASLLLNPLFASGDVAFPAKMIPASAEWFSEGKATIFFLPVFRLFEFVIGASVVWVRPELLRNTAIANCVSLSGLAMMAVAVFTYADKIVFPSFNALLPCVGAALVILAGADSLVNRQLCRWPAVAIGKISYSLYLLHWPMIVFYHHLVFRPLTPFETIALGALSIGLSALMYRFVEQPFRKVGPAGPLVADGRLLVLVATCGVLLLAVSSSAISTNGWPFRIPSGRVASTPDELREAETSYCEKQIEVDSLFTCVVDRKATKTIYVWGDSHARHLVGGLAKAYKDFNIKVLYLSSCLPQSGIFDYFYDYEGRNLSAKGCVERNREALSYFEALPPAEIILHNYMHPGSASDKKFINSTTALLNTLAARGHHVTILSDVIRPEKVLADCYAVPAILSDALIERRCIGDQASARQQEQENVLFGRQLPKGFFVNMNEFFCGSGNCIAFADGKPLFRDEHHLTIYGSEKFIEYARKHGLTEASHSDALVRAP